MNRNELSIRTSVHPHSVCQSTSIVYAYMRQMFPVTQGDMCPLHPVETNLCANHGRDPEPIVMSPGMMEKPRLCQSCLININNIKTSKIVFPFEPIGLLFGH